jgi:DNA-binding transcriptional regulator YiaG
MKDEKFQELLGAAQEALEHARGKRSLKTTEVPRAPEPMTGRAARRVRLALGMSQAVFARYLNVSTKLVQAWEAGRREPAGPALVLLHVAAGEPETLERVRHRPRQAPRRDQSRRTGNPRRAASGPGTPHHH